MAHKIVRHGTYANRSAASAEVKRLRKQGHNAHVRRDPLTGKFSVEVIVLTVALGLLGGLLHR